MSEQQRNGMDLSIFNSINHAPLHKLVRREVNSIHRRVQRRLKTADQQAEQRWDQKGRHGKISRPPLTDKCNFYVEGPGGPEIVKGV